MKATKIVLELRLVEQDEKGDVVSQFGCGRAVAFKKFDDEKASKFVSAIQSIAQTVGELLGFSVY